MTLIHVPTHDQLADIFTKPLDQATFTRLWRELGVLDFLSWCVGAPCIGMTYRHPCILDCMHFVSYALVRKIFSYIHCSPWNDIYVFVSLFGTIWLVWLSS
jgi:hypothetical protein